MGTSAIGSKLWLVARRGFDPFVNGGRPWALARPAFWENAKEREMMRYGRCE